jgi:Na+/proline symporter
MSLLLAIVGLAVLGYFTVHPELLSEGRTLEAQADELLPRFVVEVLPAGLSGLVIAAMLSAAMSSLSSGMNSSSAVITTDFISRFRDEPLSHHEAVRIARWASVAIGAVAVVLSMVVEHLVENLLGLCMRVVNLLTAPLFTLFFLALFIPWAKPRGAIAASIASVSIAVWIAFFKGFGLELLWTGPVSLVVGATVGMLVSLPNTPHAPASNKQETASS